MPKSRPGRENCKLVLTLLNSGRNVKIEDIPNIVLVDGRYYLKKEDFHGETPDYVEGAVKELVRYAENTHPGLRRITIEYEPQTMQMDAPLVEEPEERTNREDSGEDIPF